MLQPIPDHHLGLVAVANEIKRSIQNERKDCDCNVTEYVRIDLCPDPDMMSAISLMKELIEEETRSTIAYDWCLQEDRMFTVDLDERLQVLAPKEPRRQIYYGMRLRK
jgi:hypothetical protein